MPKPPSRNPPRVYRLQKVVGRLEKSPAPTAIKPGMIVSCPHDLVSDTLADYMGDKATEVFVIIFIDVRNRIVGFTEYTSGSTSSVVVDTAGVMREALLAGAAGMITAHNHPSGDPTPSADDRALWKRLRSAGDLMGVPVVDNLVVGERGKFFSEAEERT